MVPDHQFTVEYSARVIHSRLEHPLFSSFRTELIGLFILLLFWLAGAAIATVSGHGVFKTTTLVNILSTYRSPATPRISMCTGVISPFAGRAGSAGS